MDYCDLFVSDSIFSNTPSCSMDEGELVEEIERDKDCSKDDENVISQPSSSKKARKSYSKITKVTCGEKGCLAKPMLLQNLKDHAKAKHGSSHPKIKGQPTLSSMLLGSKDRRKIRGPDSGVGTAGMAESSENLDLAVEFVGLQEDVDANKNEMQEENEDQSRKEILSVARKELDTGLISDESINQITKFELLFLLEEKFHKIDELDKKELLIFVSTLVKVGEFMKGQDDASLFPKVEEILVMTAKELESERHNWGLGLVKD